jgi:two-component system CheB/CheR fusion protein
MILTVEASPQPMAILWGQDQLVFANDAFLPLLEPHLPGQPVLDLRPDLRAAIEPPLNRVGQGETVTIPVDAAPDLPQDWAGLILSPLFDEDGQVAGVLASLPAATGDATYRALLASLDAGFCLMEMIYKDGRAVDYRFLETNAVFQEQTGLTDAIGRTALELVPDLEPWWIETYARVAQSGRGERYQHGSGPMNRYFDVYATPVGPPGRGQVAVVFSDVSERRRHDQDLRQREAAKSFFLAFSDETRRLTDPGQITEIAMRGLCGHLGVNRVAFLAVEGDEYVVLGAHSEGVPPISGRFQAADFDSGLLLQWHNGRAVRSSDVLADALSPDERRNFAAINVRAYIGVPLIRSGRLIGGITVHNATPRSWTDSEVALVAQVGERAWAEIERAEIDQRLRDSEQRFRTLAEGIPQLVWRSANEGNWTWASPQWVAFTGQSVQDSLDWGWLDMVHPQDWEAARTGWARSGQEGQVRVDYRIREKATGQYRWFQTSALPVRDAQGEAIEWLGASTDVHDQHEMQERLRVLVGELQHRTRNLMAVVTTVTERTAASSRSLDVFMTTIRSRLGAVARASGLLSRLEGEERATFDALLQNEIQGNPDAASRAGQITLKGPTGVRLRSSSVQILALALHELVRNAQRDGALSVPEGRLQVTWEVQQTAGGTFAIAVDWQERVPAEADRPNLFGQGGGDRDFGRELLERALPYQLGARTAYKLTDGGLSCRIVMPILWVR